MLMLIAERDPQLVELMRDILESAGHESLHCGSVADARTFLRAPKPPGLVIVGEQLDDGPGRFVLADARELGVPGLVLTRRLRHAAELEREQTPHVIHPFRIEEFRAAVETALAGGGKPQS
jgi:DNA-binding response OmpR family regulator